MKIEFADGSLLEVKNIFGGPKLVDDVMRDVLRIEIDPSTVVANDFQPLEKLKGLFKDNPNTAVLYAITESKGTDGEIHETRSKIGDGYKIFISIAEETRRIKQVPGTLTPTRTEDIYVITIAQQTYEEYVVEQIPEDQLPPTPEEAGE